MMNKTTRGRLSLLATGGIFALASFLVVRRVPDIARASTEDVIELLIVVPIVAFLAGALFKFAFGREGPWGWGFSAVGVAIVTSIWIALGSAISLVVIPVIQNWDRRASDLFDLGDFTQLIIEGAFERVGDTILTSNAGPLWLVLMVTIHMVMRQLRRIA